MPPGFTDLQLCHTDDARSAGMQYCTSEHVAVHPITQLRVMQYVRVLVTLACAWSAALRGFTLQLLAASEGEASKAE